MITVNKIYLVAYAPSSPQRLHDLAKLAFSMSIISAFIAIRPVGIAAQAGVPEVFKLAYKLDKRFLIFPRLQDLKEIMNIEQVLLITHSDDIPDICEVDLNKNSIALVVQAGETPFTKEDLSLGTPVRLSDIDSYRSPNAVADAAIALVKLRNKVLRSSC